MGIFYCQSGSNSKSARVKTKLTKTVLAKKFQKLIISHKKNSLGISLTKKEESFKFFQAKDADSLRLIEESFDYFEKTNHKDIIKCLPPAPHRFFSYQIAFWRKQALKKMALPHETPWSSEYYGDKRAHLLPL